MSNRSISKQDAIALLLGSLGDCVTIKICRAGVVNAILSGGLTDVDRV